MNFKIQTGFLTQYEEEEEVKASTCLNGMLKEVLRLAQKNVKSSNRTYIQPMDLLSVFKYLSCNTEYLKSIILPNTNDFKHTTQQNEMSNQHQTANDDTDLLDIFDGLDRMKKDSTIDIENEVFAYASDSDQEQDPELYGLWFSQFDYINVHDYQQQTPIHLRQAFISIVEQINTLLQSNDD